MFHMIIANVKLNHAAIEGINRTEGYTKIDVKLRLLKHDSFFFCVPFASLQYDYFISQRHIKVKIRIDQFLLNIQCLY